MTGIASLPMYDWMEVRDETDAEWRSLRRGLSAVGVEAPETLVRSNAQLPPVPGGIVRDGKQIAPDPAELPPDELDFHTLWRHPDLVCSQTCWGPMELGLAEHVRVIGQPNYSAYEGGKGILYRSAILMRRHQGRGDVEVPDNPAAGFDTSELKGLRFGYNGSDSMSGLIALRRDLVAGGAIDGDAGFDDFWTSSTETGGHRQSVVLLAKGSVDVVAIDCRTLDLCRRFEPAIDEVRIVGWTAQRKGLPYIAAPALAHPKSLSSQG